MSTPSDENLLGYKRPPLHSRWKKGRSGDPRKQKHKPREGVAATIERLLLESVGITIDGEERQVPTLEAIVLQLLRKTMDGNVRAARILARYWDFAFENMERKLDLKFIDSAYTRAVAKLAKGGAGD